MHAYKGRYPLDYTLPSDSRADRYLQYAIAYKDCVEFLIENYEKKKPSHGYGLTPVLFLLRHYVELQLKGLLIFCGNDLKKLDHDISKLYNETRETVNNRYGKNIGNPDPEVEDFLLYLGEKDKGGDLFRYPETIGGTDFSETFRTADNWFYEAITDIQKLKSLVKKVIYDIDGLGIRVQELENFKNELENENSE